MINNLQGPEIQNPGNAVELEFPNCIKIVTPQDEQEFKDFLTNIINAANQNALKQLEEYCQKQNKNLDELVRKLGG